MVKQQVNIYVLSFSFGLCVRLSVARRSSTMLARTSWPCLAIQPIKRIHQKRWNKNYKKIAQFGKCHLVFSSFTFITFTLSLNHPIAQFYCNFPKLMSKLGEILVVDFSSVFHWIQNRCGRKVFSESTTYFIWYDRRMEEEFDRIMNESEGEHWSWISDERREKRELK